MKQYSHDYTKVSEAESHLYAAQQLNAHDDPIEAWKHIEDARRLLQEYLAQDNMVEDDDVADGWVKASEVEELRRMESDTLTDQEKGDTLKLRWAMAWAKAQANPDTHRVIVETNEQDPSAPQNEFGRYYMVDYWKAEDTEEGVGRLVVIRSDIAESPFEVHRPNWHHLNGYDDRATQPHCRVSNPDNITRWAEKMINAGRVMDIYADCY